MTKHEPRGTWDWGSRGSLNRLRGSLLSSCDWRKGFLLCVSLYFTFTLGAGASQPQMLANSQMKCHLFLNEEAPCSHKSRRSSLQVISVASGFVGRLCWAPRQRWTIFPELCLDVKGRYDLNRIPLELLEERSLIVSLACWGQRVWRRLQGKVFYPQPLVLFTSEFCLQEQWVKILADWSHLDKVLKTNKQKNYL